MHEGVPIAQPLIENPVFPPMVSQMVKIGEETGELEKMLAKIADFYEDEVDAAIRSLTSIIEPLMMIGVGRDGRRDHHLDVPADVQDAAARQVAAATGLVEWARPINESQGLSTWIRTSAEPDTLKLNIIPLSWCSAMWQ